MSAPAFAQSEAVEIDQSNFAVVSTPIDNDGDVNLGLTRFFSQTNIGTVTITNTDPVIDDIFAQFGVVNQSNRSESSLAISNSGDINAVLTNSVSQTNISSVAITNTDTGPIIADIFAQFGVVNQSNRFESSIAINNSGDVEAELTNSVSQTNTSSVAITNTDTASVSVADSFTQSAETHESNEVASSIAVENSGSVNAGNVGISAAITNAEIIQTNAITITLDSGGNVNADSFTQSAKAHQSNEITSSIAITNTGQVKAGNIGISATITNADITQINFSAITVDSGGRVNADSSAQSAEVDQRNEITSSIAITNSGVVEGGNIGIFAKNTSQLINQFNFSQTTLSALPGDVDVQLIDVSQTNNLVDTITIINSGSVFGGTFGIAAIGGIVNISNTGLVHVYGQPSASSTGIGVIAPESTITNRAGTIWAGFPTDGGATIHRGVAIDTVNAAALIQLQGINGDGRIYGDINIATGDNIDVTQGRTWFEGTINGKGDSNAQVGTLDIFNGGKLVLCQEGWPNACDPNGWGSANWNPQNSHVAVDGPSFVHVDTFTVQSDGTISYQMTPRSTPGTYPQVFANNVNILGGTLYTQYLPGFYDNETLYDEIISSNTPINGAGTGVNGTGFGAVKDNSILLQTTTFLDENNQAVDLQVTRTPFNQVSGLTKNEQAVGGGIEKVYSNLPGVTINPGALGSGFDKLVANLFTVDNAKDYAAILQELSGAQYAQQLQSVLFSLNPLNESITDRMDCGLNQPATKVVAGYEVTAQPFGCFTPGQVQAWARVWGGWNHNDGDVNAPSDNESQWGVWGGWDYVLRDSNWSFGLAGGYFQANMNFGQFGGVNGGSINYEGGQIAGYGAWDNRVWYDRAIVGGGFYSGESHRNFGFQSSLVDPSGHPDADAVSFYNEAGRRFWVEPNVALTPFIGVSVMSSSIDSFTESDPRNTGAALRIGNSDDTQTSTLLGGRFNGTWGLFRPEVAVAWEHYFDTTVGVNASFAQASWSTFKEISSDIGSDGVLVDAGLAYALGPNSDLSVRYVGQFLENYDSNSVMGRWTHKWGGAPVAAPPTPIANPPLK